MINEGQIRVYLNVIKRAVAYIESMLSDTDGGMLEKMVGDAMPTPQAMQNIPTAPAQTPVASPHSPARQVAPIESQASPPSSTPPVDEEWKRARRQHVRDLLNIDVWPEAVASCLMAKPPTKEDQIQRANAVLDMVLDRDVVGLDVLDFGCGEGWITHQIVKRGAKSVTGYDIKLDPNWTELTGPVFTSKFTSLTEHGYDMILLYDVLDHCEDPLDLMSKIRFLSKPKTRIYIRCHPWTAKHGNHLWKFGLNKSYLHLFLTWDELKEIIGQPPIFTRSEKNPMEAYHWWLHDFEVVKEKPIREDVHGFFYNPDFKQLLAMEQKLSEKDVDAFLDFMQIQFVDFVALPKGL